MLTAAIRRTHKKEGERERKGEREGQRERQKEGGETEILTTQ